MKQKTKQKFYPDNI